jgi:ribose/xylose/arabinose/galactoside ABC-type transport system permease subunit
MVKGAIIVGAVILDQYRNNKLKNKDKDIWDMG